VEHARRIARRYAEELRFDPVQTEELALAITELGTNLLRYAGAGELSLTLVQGPRGDGIRIESRDEGPGIEDVELAMRDGYSTGGGLGSGLPSVRRLMDEFQLNSGPQGTSVVATKWQT
jgi:serine/threonine-protein kinase RsbT